MLSTSLATMRPRVHRSVYTPSPTTRAYILQQLRESDNENYVANLLQPRHVQGGHAAIRSLNLQLAQIRNSVSNEDMGRLRIAHFRTGLEHVLSSAHSAPETPVMQALAESVTTFPDVDFVNLHTLVDAREKDLGYPNYATIAELERFARDTQGTLVALHAEMLGEDVSEVADIAGTAVGLAIILRGAPAHAASRLSYMPKDIVQRSGVSQKSLLTGGSDSQDVFRVVGERADALLREADARVAGLNGDLKPAFWPLRMAEIFLERLRRSNWNPFDEGLQRGLRTTYPLALQIRLLRLRLFG